MQLTLNNGVSIPALGFGVYQIPPDKTAAAVSGALEVGYRMIDTAASYDNERAVGQAVRNSGLARDEVFLQTKIWITDYGFEKTLHAFDKSAGKLGVDVIDLLLLHQAMPGEFDQTSMPTGHWNDSLKRGRFAPSGSVTLWLNIFEHCAIGPTLSLRSTRSRCTHFSRNRQCVNYIMHGISSRRPGHPSVVSPTTWAPEPRLSKTRPLALSPRNISAHQPRSCWPGNCNTDGRRFQSL